MENDLINELLAIFPNIEAEVIEQVLRDCGGNGERATEVLFSFNEVSQPNEMIIHQETIDDLPPEALEKIRLDELADQKEKLKKCKEFDKEMEKALSASTKEFQKEQKRLAKAKKAEEKKKNRESNQKVKKEEEIPVITNQIYYESKDKYQVSINDEICSSPIGKEKNQPSTYNEIKLVPIGDSVEKPIEKPIEKTMKDESYNKPQEKNIISAKSNANPSNKQIGFGQKLKNIFKRKGKAPDKDSKSLDIEIPDISKTNMIPKSEYQDRS